MSPSFQPIDDPIESSSQILSHQRCSISRSDGGGVARVDKKLYPQQHSLRTTKMAKNHNRIKPVLRKRLEYAFSTDTMRANNGGINMPSWRKDGIKKRERLLQEDEENGGNSFVIDRRSNLKNYYAIAERVLDQFQITCASSNKLEETYLMGNRLIKFLSDVLPKHRHYHNKDPSLVELRIKSQNDLAQVRIQVDNIALLFDKEQYRQIMEMEGMEGDFCPSPTSRRRNRKRVTFNLQQPPSPVASPDQWNRNLEQEEQEPLHGCKNNFVWNNDKTTKLSDYFESNQYATKNTSTTPPIFLKNDTTDNGNDNVVSDAWESFGNDCGADWDLQWPETVPTDAAIVPSRLPPSFDGNQVAQQQPAHRYNLADDCDDARGSDSNDMVKNSCSNNGECASSSPTSITDNDLDKVERLESEIFEMETPSLFTHSASNDKHGNDIIQASDNDDIALKGCKYIDGECSYDESDDELEHQEYIKKMRELDFTDDAPIRCHCSGGEKTIGTLETEVLEFSDDLSSPCDSSGGDKTIATAETEAMTADDDSESPSTNGGVGDAGSLEQRDSTFDQNQIPSKLAYLECKVKDLQQVNRVLENASSKPTAGDSLSTAGRNNTITSATESSQQAYLKVEGLNSSSDTPSNIQNDMSVNPSEIKYQLKQPLQHKTGNISVLEHSRNHSSSPILNGSPKSQGQPLCSFTTREVPSKLRNIDDSIPKSTASYLLSPANKSQASQNPQDELRTNLVEPSMRKYPQKYSLRFRGRERNISVSESSPNHSSPIMLRPSPKSHDQLTCKISSSKVLTRSDRLVVNKTSKVPCSEENDSSVECKSQTSLKSGSRLQSQPQNDILENGSEAKHPLHFGAGKISISDSIRKHSSLNFQSKPLLNSTLAEVAYNVQNNQEVNTTEKKHTGMRDSEIIQARRAKAIKLKKWRRRYGNTTPSTK